MSIWREVGRKFAVWLLMFSVTAAGIHFAASRGGPPPQPGRTSFLVQAVLVGSLFALNLIYFSVRLNNEKVTRGMVAFILIALYFFPDYVWGAPGRVFAGVEPVVSALLVMLAGSVALNVALHLTDFWLGRGRRPS